jgi:ATP-binding cassette, subfamily C (CFTR/MRP), member 4
MKDLSSGEAKKEFTTEASKSPAKKKEDK